jgi:hypothetical protein
MSRVIVWSDGVTDVVRPPELLDRTREKMDVGLFADVLEPFGDGTPSMSTRESHHRARRFLITREQRHASLEAALGRADPIPLST